MLGLDMLMNILRSFQRNRVALDRISQPFLLKYPSTKMVRAMLLITTALTISIYAMAAAFKRSRVAPLLFILGPVYFHHMHVPASLH